MNIRRCNSIIVFIISALFIGPSCDSGISLQTRLPNIHWVEGKHRGERSDNARGGISECSFPLFLTSSLHQARGRHFVFRGVRALACCCFCCHSRRSNRIFTYIHALSLWNALDTIIPLVPISWSWLKQLVDVVRGVAAAEIIMVARFSFPDRRHSSFSGEYSGVRVPLRLIFCPSSLPLLRSV